MRAVLVVLALGALGAAMPKLSLPELVRRSDMIVEGRVLTRASSLDLGENGKPKAIWTRTTVAVRTPIKGSPGSEITLLELGGVSGHYSMSLPGAAKLETGEDVLLFLKCSGPCAIVGLAQGKYRVTSDPLTGRRVAQRDFDDESPIDFEALGTQVRGLVR